MDENSFASKKRTTLFLQVVLCVLIATHASLYGNKTLAAEDNWLESTPAEQEATRRVDDIDRNVVLEFIRLSRFNIKYHMEANRHQKWRALTYPATREAGTAVGFAGSLIDLKQRIRGFDDPRLISRDELRNVLACVVVGSAISGGASSLELAQNTWMMMRARKLGYSVKDSIAFVKTTSDKIDALLDERERIVLERIPKAKQRVFEVEGVLFRRIHQQLLVEFRNWSCHSREQAWRENTFYTVDALQNFTRMGSSIIGMKAFSNPNLGGGAVISGLVANSVGTINPIFRNVVGVVVRKYHRRKLSKQIRIDRPIPMPLTTLEELKQREAQRNPDEKKVTLLDEALLLSDRSARLDLHLDRETKEIERYRQVAQQQSISGPMIGLTGVTSSILAAVAFYEYPFDREKTNSLLFSGRVTQIVGQSYALLNTAYTVTTGTMRNRRLAARGELPSQILEQRLKNIDVFEKKILEEKKFP